MNDDVPATAGEDLSSGGTADSGRRSGRGCGHADHTHESNLAADEPVDERLVDVVAEFEEVEQFEQRSQEPLDELDQLCVELPEDEAHGGN